MMEDEKTDEVQKKRMKSEPMKKADSKNKHETSLCTIFSDTEEQREKNGRNKDIRVPFMATVMKQMED